MFDARMCWADELSCDRIDSMDSLAKRRDLEHHQEIARLIKEHDLIEEPLRYFVLKEEGGW
jgi:hypothetical protein